jgi:hypothetical protein
MKIDVYTICRNEARMMPYFLRHYETFANRIFVWDEDSNDGTHELLTAHPKVTLLPYPSDCPRGMQDNYWATHQWQQYKELSRGRADWVMIVDADELIYSLDLVGTLRDCRARKVDVLVCRNFIMVAEEFPVTNGQIYDVVKLGLRDGTCDKWCTFNPAIDVTFKPGRNRNPAQLSTNAVEWNRLLLLHYRNLGLHYMRERNAKNVVGMGVPADYFDRLHNQPNSRRGRVNIYQWHEENKGKAERVVCRDWSHKTGLWQAE